MEFRSQPRRFSQVVARAILRLGSWKLVYTPPASPKYVLVGAPHTSNLDFLYTLLFKYATGVRLHWIGKDSLFRWPLGGIMRRLGGIPVNRRSSNRFVDQIVEVFNRTEELVIAIAPEGTRGWAESWKTGFYYIALGAGVPIALGFIDYREKVLGIGSSFFPTGDIQVDFARISEFYTGKTGLHPERQGEIRIREQGIGDRD